MTFLGLITQNVLVHKLRASLTAAAVAIGVMAVLALGVLTASLQETATQILQVGNADLTVAQRHVDDIINSSISQDDITEIGSVAGVDTVVGALIETDRYDDAHPLVIEVGLNPAEQQPFGVNVLAGRSYRSDADDELMLGYALARSIDKKPGDQLALGGHRYTVTGLYSTNVSFGNSTVMFPLATLQALNRVPGQVSLGFVKVKPGADKAVVAKAIDAHFVNLTTISSNDDFGRADRSLVLIKAANTGGTVLAAVIAITGVLNTTLLSFFERTREFGVLRSVGWSRWRIVALVLGEAVLVGVVGAAMGVLLGWVAVNVLQQLSQLRGYFVPIYDAAIFARALYFAFGVAVLGALYPAVRAAFISPMAALRSE